MCALKVGLKTGQNRDSKLSRNNGLQRSLKVFAFSKRVVRLSIKRTNCVQKMKNYFLTKHTPRFGGVKQIFPKNNVTGSPCQY